MWEMKTKREIHVSYMLEIDRLEDEIIQLDHDNERIYQKKKIIVERIHALKETAKLFE